MLVNVIAGCHLNLRYSDMNGLFGYWSWCGCYGCWKTSTERMSKFRTFKFVLTLQLGSLLLECSWVVTGLSGLQHLIVTYRRISHWGPSRCGLCVHPRSYWSWCLWYAPEKLPIKGCRIVLGFVCQVLILFWLSFLVLFALYLQQLGTRTCHFAKYLLHFGTLTSHVHGICYILVLQTFMWVSCGFLQVFIQGFI